MNPPKKEEILINVTPQETRVAIIENGVLQEIHIERNDAKGMVGNVYKGKIVRVLPGMQAAFVEIGLQRTAFLHANDAKPMLITGEVDTSGDDDRKPINELVREGQEVLVQVVKDPIGSKGARLTTEITIPSRYLVYLPYSTTVGISQRINDEHNRETLRAMIDTLKEQKNCPGGYIARTTAETTQASDLQQDMDILCKLWEKTQGRERNCSAPSLVHEDLPLALRVVRDFVRESVTKVLIDSSETFDKIKALAQELMPDSITLFEHYPGERPIFDLYSTEDDIQRALQRTVTLKSGGHLVFDQTESMTTIDVNTGSYTGRKNLEETVFKTNLEAARTVARQLRLRNLGGIIIVDFIDMHIKSHQNQVLGALERGLAKDTTKNSFTEFSALGLVEITRKRTSESLEHQLMEDCLVCKGRGMLKTTQTICNEIFREIMREARQFDEANIYMVIASQQVIDRLLDEESTHLANLQDFIGAPIQLQVEATYFQEDYDIVLS